MNGGRPLPVPAVTFAAVGERDPADRGQITAGLNGGGAIFLDAVATAIAALPLPLLSGRRCRDGVGPLPGLISRAIYYDDVPESVLHGRRGRPFIERP